MVLGTEHNDISSVNISSIEGVSELDVVDFFFHHGNIWHTLPTHTLRRRPFPVPGWSIISSETPSPAVGHHGVTLQTVVSQLVRIRQGTPFMPGVIHGLLLAPFV